MYKELMNFISKLTSGTNEILPDVLLLDFTIVNACVVGTNDHWVLVDAGLSNSEEFILTTTIRRFDSPPKAIVLTHGHFDHVGSLERLAEYWNVPVFAHPLEMPYLLGKKDYPLADSTVDEGLVAKMSPHFPHSAINLGFRLAPLPDDGTVPGMDGWHWFHTPGHTEGHVAFFRESDRTLIAGDAFTTTKQESLLSVLTHKEQIKGPPAYLTPDWDMAKNSIAQLIGLKPELAIPSHGLPMSGEKLREHLDYLIQSFNDIAIPDKGRFVDNEESRGL